MKIAKIFPLLLLTFFFFLTQNAEASVNTSITQQVKQNQLDANNNDTGNSIEDIKKEINEKKDSFEIEGSLEKIQGLAIPMLVVVVIISGILFILGWIVQPLRMKAWTLIGLAILTYVCVMFPFNIIGAMMAAIDWILSLFFVGG